MKSIKWVLVAVVLSAALSACKQPEPAAPAAEATPAPAEAVVAAEPTTTPEAAPADAAAMPPADAAATDMPPADTAEDSEDSPHSGGDKVKPAAEPAAGG